MKKLFTILALMCALVVISSCSKKDSNEPEISQENAPKKTVTFNVSGLGIETTPINAPRRAPIYDDEGEDGRELTDLFLFDGTTEIAHQTNSQENFGTLEVQLELGVHNLHFVATRSTGITNENGIMSFASIRSTFGEHLTMNITGATVSEAVTLTRVNGQLVIDIEDETIPSDVDSLGIEFAVKYSSLNVTNFNGANGGASRVVAKKNNNGVISKSYTLNLFAATYGEQYTTTVTIKSYKHDGSVYVRVVEDVPIATNTKTKLHGELYRGATSAITVDVEWNDDIVGSM